MTNLRRQGASYEAQAAAFLISHGAKILAQNYRTPAGEVDLIVRDGRFTVFVEVKYRAKETAGEPAEAVDYKKQRTICRVADHYRVKNGLSDDDPVRFDVIAVKRIAENRTAFDWIENAFDYISW